MCGKGKKNNFAVGKEVVQWKLLNGSYIQAQTQNVLTGWISKEIVILSEGDNKKM
jgi:hypothetical protein